MEQPSAAFGGGRFELRGTLGAGGAGVVYRAFDRQLQREVALKLLRASVPSPSWLEEARALARVRDPHVVGVHGVALHDGRAGLWMEFLHGPTLEAEIAHKATHAVAPRRDGRPRAAVRRGRAPPRRQAGEHRADDRRPRRAHRLRPRHACERGSRGGLTRRAGLHRERLRGASPAPATTCTLGVTLRCAFAGTPPFESATLDELRDAAARGPRCRSPPCVPTPPRWCGDRPGVAADTAARFADADALVRAFDVRRPAPPWARRDATDRGARADLRRRSRDDGATRAPRATASPTGRAGPTTSPRRPQAGRERRPRCQRRPRARRPAGSTRATRKTWSTA